MREEYDFSQSRENPYAKGLKKQITINLDADTVKYFKTQSALVGIPYQTLINLYFADCAAKKKRPRMSWE
jgi:predicted DNA binding CopG/RHH family protein